VEIQQNEDNYAFRLIDEINVVGSAGVLIKVLIFSDCPNSLTLEQKVKCIIFF
jgi:hypothetical protein